MHFEEKYPKLWNFFGGYFPDADFDNLTDEAVITAYRLDLSDKDSPQVVAELDRLIIDDFYWEQAALEANRYFATQAAQLSWLLMVRRELTK